MARCEICDYCDNVGQSTYNDSSGYKDEFDEDRASDWSRFLKGSSTVTHEMAVWGDEKGELCSECRRSIQDTVWDDRVLHEQNSLDKMRETRDNIMGSGRRKEKASE